MDADRTARGFERAVLAWSMRAPEPILLDRTLNSLTPLARYLREVPGSDSSIRAAYLTMVALTERGRDADVSALGPLDGPFDADRLARDIRALPARGAPWVRPCIGVVEIQGEMNLRRAPEIAERVIAALPALSEGEVVDGEDEWSLIVDPDELRVDVELDRIRVTGLFADARARDEALFDIFGRLGDLYEQSGFGVGYDPDEVPAVRYMTDRFEGALPNWIFVAYGLARTLVPEQPLETAHEIAAIRPTRELVTRLGLDAQWPHYRW